jgi:hypothetical protein
MKTHDLSVLIRVNLRLIWIFSHAIGGGKVAAGLPRHPASEHGEGSGKVAA